jgi:hypothetical protein
MTTFKASRMVGSEELLILPSLSFPEDAAITFSALFSFQRKDASAAPAAKNPMDNSNGPDGPRAPAAAPAS